MAVVVVILAAIVVFVIAAVVIGREARRLDAVAPRVTYELDEAVAFVADGLGDDAAAVLTPEDLGDLLRWHLHHLWQRGLQPDGLLDRPQDPSREVVLHEDDAVAHLMGQAEAAGRPVPDEVVVEVVDLHFLYLATIGAVGPQAPDVP